MIKKTVKRKKKKKKKIAKKKEKKKINTKSMYINLLTNVKDLV
jgi:hypothetical protein